jgi:hypothetical protein
VKLREIAHSRTGDKGDTSNISLIAFDAENYERLRREVTVERVAEHFASLVRGPVERYELPQIAALNFVMRSALRGGVTRSLSLDSHGKSFGSALLEMEIGEDSAAAATQKKEKRETAP